MAEVAIYFSQLISFTIIVSSSILHTVLCLFIHSLSSDISISVTSVDPSSISTIWDKPIHNINTWNITHVVLKEIG